jgi:hypothetical protein
MASLFTTMRGGFDSRHHLSDFASVSRRQLRTESAEAEASHPDVDSADVADAEVCFGKQEIAKLLAVRFSGVDGRIASRGLRAGLTRVERGGRRR